MNRQRLPIDFSVWPVASDAVGSMTVPLGSTPNGWNLLNPIGGGAVAVEPDPRFDIWNSGVIDASGDMPRLGIPDLLENGIGANIRGDVGVLPSIVRFRVVFNTTSPVQSRGSVRVWLAATPDFQNGIFFQVEREYRGPETRRLPPFGCLNNDPAARFNNALARANYAQGLNAFPSRVGLEDPDRAIPLRYTFGYAIDGSVETSEPFTSFYGNEDDVIVEFGFNPFNLIPEASERIVYALILRAGTSRAQTPRPGGIDDAGEGPGATGFFTFDIPIDFAEPFGQWPHLSFSVPTEAIGSADIPMQSRTTLIEILPTTTQNSPAILPRFFNVDGTRQAAITLRNAVAWRYTPLVPSDPSNLPGLTPVCLSPRASYAFGGLPSFVPDIADTSPYATKDGPTWHEQAIGLHGTAAGTDGATPELTVVFPPGFIPYVTKGTSNRIIDDPESEQVVVRRSARLAVRVLSGISLLSEDLNPEAFNVENPGVANLHYRNTMAGRAVTLQPFLKAQRLLPGMYRNQSDGPSRTLEFTTEQILFNPSRITDQQTLSFSWESNVEVFAMTYRRFPVTTVNLAGEEAWSEYEKLATEGVAIDSFDYWTRRPARFVEPADVRIILDIRIQFLTSHTPFNFDVGFFGQPVIQAREVYRRVGIRIPADRVVALANGQPVQGELMGRGYGRNEFNTQLVDNPEVAWEGFPGPSWESVFDNFDTGLGVYPVEVRLNT
jgi:hypothetical protein